MCVILQMNFECWRAAVYSKVMSVGKYLTELKHYTKFRRLPVQTAIAAGDALEAQPRYKTPGNHWLNIAQKRND